MVNTFQQWRQRCMRQVGFRATLHMFIFIDKENTEPDVIQHYHSFYDWLRSKGRCVPKYPNIFFCISALIVQWVMRSCLWQIRLDGDYPFPGQSTADVLQIQGLSWSCTRGRWFHWGNLLLGLWLQSREPYTQRCRVIIIMVVYISMEPSLSTWARGQLTL